MTGSVNITRAEAQERSALLTSHSYRVIVDLTGRGVDEQPLPDPQATFLSTTTARFSSQAGTSWIDLIADQVVDAWLDGKQLDPTTHNGYRLPLELDEGEHQLTVTAICRYSRTGEGLHRFVDPADDKIYLYTQFETADARRMYACFDQPDQKATFQLSVIANKDWKVYSNSPTPQPVAINDELANWEFAATPPISSYITALVAGEFYVQPGTIRSIKGELGADLVCRESMAEFLDVEQMMTTTQRGFEIFEEHFGREYPFEKYDQLFLPEYNAGAMENAGCVTFRDEYLFRSKVTATEYSQRDNTILHELSHMWFGDLVTMKWWDDLWLNESFAEFASTWCQAEIAKRYGTQGDSWTDFANRRKLWAYRCDQLPTTHPVAADMIDLETVDQNFDGITYAKGASVLKQLVAYVGQDNFFTGVRAYFAQHAWGNTEFDDLVGALERASGRDLSQFAEHWLASSGVNVVKPVVEYDEAGNYRYFNIEQSCIGQQVYRTHRLAIGLYDLVDDKLVCRDSLEVDVHGEITPIAVLAGQRKADVILLNDRDLSYVKVRFDNDSLAFLEHNFAKLENPLARAMVWTSLWDTWRDAEMSSARYLRFVLEGLTTEVESTAIINQLQQAGLAVTSYCAPQQRASLRARLTGGLAELLKQAEPGSDKQLAIADGLIGAVDSPVGAELLAGWLNNEEVPEGLVIDADRRWAIVTTLARLGYLGVNEIDQEANRDKTIAGQEFAAGARSALANSGTKQQAWQRATAEPDIPNGTHLAVAANFWKFGQEELLAGYQERYLQVVAQMADGSAGWDARGHIAKQTVLTLLWPTPLADKQFIAKLSAWMSSRQLPEQVRRVLTEQRDNSQRAARVAALSGDDLA